MGEVFLKDMISLRDDFEIVGDVRGKGLMLGMEMVKNKVSYTYNGICHSGSNYVIF